MQVRDDGLDRSGLAGREGGWGRVAHAQVHDGEVELRESQGVRLLGQLAAQKRAVAEVEAAWLEEDSPREGQHLEGGVPEFVGLRAVLAEDVALDARAGLVDFRGRVLEWLSRRADAMVAV